MCAVLDLIYVESGCAPAVRLHRRRESRVSYSCRSTDLVVLENEIVACAWGFNRLGRRGGAARSVVPPVPQTLTAVCALWPVCPSLRNPNRPDAHAKDEERASGFWRMRHNAMRRWLMPACARGLRRAQSRSRAHV